jgi:hypothetical protein
MSRETSSESPQGTIKNKAKRESSLVLESHEATSFSEYSLDDSVEKDHKFFFPTNKIFLVIEADGKKSRMSEVSNQKYGLIILGNSGVGKSFIANVLYGKEQFVHKFQPFAVTTETEEVSCQVRHLVVIEIIYFHRLETKPFLYSIFQDWWKPIKPKSLKIKKRSKRLLKNVRFL